MKIKYAIEKFRWNENFPSVFLAGPTPRSPEVKSWRPEAIRIMQEMEIKATIIVPESEDGIWKQSYVDQIDWELNGLDNCTKILMWVPRDMKTMPALTTNIEFGLYVKSFRLFYGRPDGAPSTSYMDYVYNKYTLREPATTLRELIEEIFKERIL